MNVYNTECAIISKIYQKHDSLQEAFSEFDTHHRGKLSVQDFRRGLHHYGIEITDGIVRDLVSKYDTNGEGMFDYNEFVRMNEDIMLAHSRANSVYKDTFSKKGLSTWSHPPEKLVESQQERAHRVLAAIREKLHQHSSPAALRELFLKLDRDRSGALTYAEIRFGLHQLGLDVSAQDLYHILIEYDTSRNGLIDLESFFNLLSTRLTESAVHDKTHEEIMESFKGAPELDIPVHATYTVEIHDGGVDSVAISKISRVLEDKRMSLKKTFSQLDTDATGVISKQQLVDGLADIGIKISSTRADRLIRHYSQDGSEGMHYYEFVRMISNALADAFEEKGDDPHSHLATEEGPDSGVLETITAISHAVYDRYGQLKKAFRKMDHSGTKHLSLHDFSAAMEHMGLNLASSEVESLYQKFDRDGKGLSYSEFVTMISVASAKF